MSEELNIDAINTFSSEDNINEKLIITIDGRAETVPLESLGIDMSTPPSDVLETVKGMFSEINFDDDYGNVSYTVRKATNTNTIFVFPKPVAGVGVEEVPEYNDDKRLQIYNMLTGACTHLYSKGKLQEDKFMNVASIFADLAKNDPIFLVHLTAWAMKSDNKDLQVLSVFFNSLNDGDGTPFFKGSKSNKPNYRKVSYACLNDMSPHLACRVLELCHKKFSIDGTLNDGRHFSTGFRKAFKKYLKFRERNPEGIRAIKNAGLSKKFINMYRMNRVSPSLEAASILGWSQKDGQVNVEKHADYSKMTSNEIVEELKFTKMNPVVALTLIPQSKITTSVAKQLLENASGNQAVILYNQFAKNGFLEVKSINDLFKKKVKSSGTAIDRLDRLSKDADEEDKKDLSIIRSEKRKKVAREYNIGSVFIHIDASSSMNSAIDFAKKKSSLIAECIDNPEENFHWGYFNNSGRVLPTPNGFTREDFESALWGVRASGLTDCIALYKSARFAGAEVDIYITDQGHNVGSITSRINSFHEENPAIPKPKAAVIVDYSNNRNAMVVNQLESGLKNVGIPVTCVDPSSLDQSALVAQAVATAIKGEVSIIEKIMDTELPELPFWWNEVKVS